MSAFWGVGTVENFRELRADLEKQGAKFVSERSRSSTMIMADLRPGFDRLVVDLCAGQGSTPRGWHAMAATGTISHLVELCGLVGECVIDLDGVYVRVSAIPGHRFR